MSIWENSNPVIKDKWPGEKVRFSFFGLIIKRTLRIELLNTCNHPAYTSISALLLEPQ